MIKAISPGKMSLNEKYLICQSKAIKLMELSDFEKAQKQLEGLLQLNYKPSSYEALTLNNLSLAYMKQKLYNKAMITLTKALIKAKGCNTLQHHVGTLFNLSAASSNLGIHSEALAYSSKALKLLQNSSDYNLIMIACYNLGIEYIYLFRYQEAEEVLKKAVKLASENPGYDYKLYLLIMKALNQVISRKSKECEAPYEKSKTKTLVEITARKKLGLTKNILCNEITSLQGSAPNRLKKVEKVHKPIKNRTESHFSSRNLASAGRKSEKISTSGTSSTESINTSSKGLRQSFNSSKHLRNMKGSYPSTPHRSNSNILLHLPEYETRITNIGDHLNNIEKKLNDFVELCKPLKILTEDPDEQLDSHRLVKCNLRAIVFIQRIAKRQLARKIRAAIKIQRAFREYIAAKPKFLIKFKDNPLFKNPKPALKKTLSGGGISKNTNRST